VDEGKAVWKKLVFRAQLAENTNSAKTSKPNSLSAYLIKMLVVLLINQKDYILANYLR